MPHSFPMLSPAVGVMVKIRSFLKAYERSLLGGGFVILLFIVWEAAARYGVVDRRFSSEPSAILRAAIQIVGTGELWDNARVTLMEFAVGYGLAVIIGLSVGIVAGWSLGVARIIDPFLMAFSSTPRSALIPILLLWFGLGLASKVILVFVAAVIPITVNTITGVRGADSRLRQVAQSFGASLMDEGRYIILPGSLPHVFAGLRIGLNLGLIGVIVSEMYVSTVGIGRMMVLYGSVLRVDELFVYVIFVSLFGGLLVFLLSLLERILIPWHSA